jgi:hypothetical protein
LLGGIEGEEKQNAYESQQQQALAADQARRDALVAQQQAIYGPIQQQMAQEAANPMPLNYGANLGNINRQTQMAGQALDANMAKRGMTGSGLQAAGMQGLEVGRVGELSSAFNSGLNARRELGMGLLQHYNPLGNAELQTGGLEQQMGFGTREQDLYNKSMQEGFGAVGKGLGGFLNGMGRDTQETVPEVGGLGTNAGTLQDTQTLGRGGGTPVIQGQSPQMPGQWNSPDIGGTFMPPSGEATQTLPFMDNSVMQGGGLNMAPALAVPEVPDAFSSFINLGGMGGF